MLKSCGRIELYHRLRREPPRLYPKDVLPGILLLAKTMPLFVHYGTLLVRSCITLLLLVRLYGSVLSSCLHVWSVFLFRYSWDVYRSIHALDLSSSSYLYPT